MQDPRGNSVNYSYDAVGNLVSLSDALLNTTSYVYDGLDRQISETNQLGDARSYEYDDSDNLTAIVDRNQRRTEYVYDALDRLTDEKWLDGVSVIRTIAHAYDDAGNLVSASDSDFTYGYTYDGLGQLKTQSNQGTPGVPVVSFAYQYDNGGDLISRSEVIGSGPAVTTGYDVNHLGQLVGITHSGSGVSGQIDLPWNTMRWASSM